MQKLFLGLFFICLGLKTSLAEPKNIPVPQLLAPQIEGLITETGTGTYADLIRHILKTDDLPVTVLPYSRALGNLLRAEEPTCFFPGTFELADSLGFSNENFIQSQPFNTVYGQIVYADANHHFGELEELSGKTLVVRQGFPVPKILKEIDIKIIAVKDLAIIYEMIRKGRTEYAYIHQPDMNVFYMSSGKQKLFEHHQKLDVAGERFLCNAGAKQFVEYLNTEIDKLYQNGLIFGILHYTFTGRP